MPRSERVRYPATICPAAAEFADRRISAHNSRQMELIERNTKTGSTRIINVLECADLGHTLELNLQEVFCLGIGIQHFLRDGSTERRIDILNNCAFDKPYIARCALS